MMFNVAEVLISLCDAIALIRVIISPHADDEVTVQAAAGGDVKQRGGAAAIDVGRRQYHR